MSARRVSSITVAALLVLAGGVASAQAVPPSVSSPSSPPSSASSPSSAAQSKADLTPLSSEGWRRSAYKPGGGDAQLLFVVFGQWKEKFDVARGKYRTRGLPLGAAAQIHAIGDEGCKAFTGGAFMHLLRNKPTLASAVRAAPQCMTVLVDVPDPSTLEYLRDTIGFVTGAVDAGGVAVLDVKAAFWWTPSDWRAKVFGPPRFDARVQVTILISEEADGSRWLHTRGLRKLARPDLSARHIKPAAQPAYLELIAKLIMLQADGENLASGRHFTTASLPPPGVTLKLGGSMADVDFNNVHFDLLPPR